MKQLYFAVAIAVCTMAGCRGKQETSGEVDKRFFQIDSIDKITGAQRMQVSRVTREIVCGGQKYTLSINRLPCDSLARVKSDLGVFVDNRITLTVTRPNGTVFFSKVFTKKDFAPYVPERFLSHSILEGMVFDDEKTEAGGNNLVFATSLSFPMTDLFVPFSVTISQSGKMTVERDEELVNVPVSTFEDRVGEE